MRIAPAVRIARFVSHADGSEANLAGARADIGLAQKYAGGTPHVLVRAAGLAFLVDRDLPRALGLIEAAEQVGPLDSGLLLTKGNFLMFAGRLDESLAVQAQAARLDPGNAGIYRYWVSNLAAAHRPGEMVRVLADFDSRFPGRLYRGEYLFQFTGSTSRWWDEVTRLRGGADPNVTLSAEFDLLRYEQRYPDLRALLAAAGSPEFGQHNAARSRVGASLKPVAELRGWERMLARDATGAAREGRLLAAFRRAPAECRLERVVAAPPARRERGHARRRRGRPRAHPSRAAFDRRHRAFPESNPRPHDGGEGARVGGRAGRRAGAARDALARVPGRRSRDDRARPLLLDTLASNPRWRSLEQALNAELAANQPLLR
jgi:hypothetical protein